jgi:hypothetical protein
VSQPTVEDILALKPEDRPRTNTTLKWERCTVADAGEYRVIFFIDC